MSATEAVVLGVVQGLTEFLPISSSAHLRVVPALLGWADPGAAYSAVLQLGSVLAVLTYFFKDLLKLALGSFKALQAKDLENHDLRVTAAILLGTVPIGILGLALKHTIEAENSPLRGLVVVGVASIGMGILLLIAEKMATHKRGMESIGVRDGVLVGLGQCMALIPGCSRSGSTLTVAMFMNMKRDEAARFSFLLGIPAIVLSGLLELKDMLEAGIDAGSGLSLAMGLVASTVVSYAAIAWFIKYLQKHSTWVFVVYRIIFGVAIIYLSTQSMIH